LYAKDILGVKDTNSTLKFINTADNYIMNFGPVKQGAKDIKYPPSL